jgi:hypothetical protein
MLFGLVSHVCGDRMKRQSEETEYTFNLLSKNVGTNKGKLSKCLIQYHVMTYLFIIIIIYSSLAPHGA